MPDSTASSRLQGLFMEELEDRLRAFDADLLALEAADSEAERGDAVNRLFRGAHSLKGAAAAVGAGAVELVCHQLEDTLAGLRDGTLQLSPAHVEVLFRGSDALRQAGRALEAPSTVAAPQPSARPAPSAASPPDGLLRVAAEKVDRLLEQSAELHAVRLRLAALQTHLDEAVALAPRIPPAAGVPVRELARALDRTKGAASRGLLALETVSTELERLLREVRMVSFASTCAGLDRVARDVAKTGGKAVALEVAGADIGVDGAIAERLRDPLVHLVSNAVDHGIESPERRTAAGKPATGRVRLEAALRSGHVEIVVSDDGGGIDVSALRAAAHRRGIEVRADDEALHLAFRPGISTAPALTERSGRGVGLDAVRAEIEAMRGTVAVTTQTGRGTRFTLTLPFTLSTMRVVLFRCAGALFAVNSAWVSRFVRLGPQLVATVQGRPRLLGQGVPLPLVSCAEVLGLPSDVAPESLRVAMIVDALGVPLALAVDELLDECEVTFRPLGPRLLSARYVSGAAVLADGSLALVLRGSRVCEDAVTAAQHSRTTPATASVPREQRRLLLVDDSVTTRALERSILEAAGYTVLTAADGRHAWELLEREPVDLVVSDVDMPVMDGFALVESVRRSSRLRDLPVVLVTARESEGDRRRGLDAGADAYIVKSSFRQEALLEAIEDLL